jgi:hypothetical protein
VCALAHVEEGIDAEHAVADLELRHRCADFRDLAGELAARNPAVRPPEALEEAGDKRRAGTSVSVGAIDRARVDLDEQLSFLRDGTLDLLDPEDVGRAVAIGDDGFHERWIGPP